MLCPLFGEFCWQFLMQVLHFRVYMSLQLLWPCPYAFHSYTCLAFFYSVCWCFFMSIADHYRKDCCTAKLAGCALVAWIGLASIFGVLCMCHAGLRQVSQCQTLLAAVAGMRFQLLHRGRMFLVWAKLGTTGSCWQQYQRIYSCCWQSLCDTHSCLASAMCRVVLAVAVWPRKSHVDLSVASTGAVSLFCCC